MSIKLNSGYVMPTVGIGMFMSEPGEVGQAVHLALDAGYRHIDCAWSYGNEAEVGVALGEAFSSGKVKREDVFITSKLWNNAHTSEAVKPQLKDTLTKLGLDYLDLYLIHWPMAFKTSEELFPRDDLGNVIYVDVPLLETWAAMERCVDEGLVRSIGFSNFNSQQIQQIVDKGRIKPAVLQVEVHPYFTQEKLVKFCQDRGIAVVAYSPLGAPRRPWGVPGEPVVMEDPVLKQVAANNQKTRAQVMLRWLIQRGIQVIPKSVTPSRIQENFQVLDFHLSDEDMRLISALNRNFRLMDEYVMKDGKQHFLESEKPNFPHNADF